MAKVSAEVKEGAGVNPDKLKALQATLDKIEKDFGKGTIMKLGDQPNGTFPLFRPDPLR